MDTDRRDAVVVDFTGNGSGTRPKPHLVGPKDVAPKSADDNPDHALLWTSLYSHYGALNKSFEASTLSNQYRIINYRAHSMAPQATLGIITSYALAQHLGIAVSKDGLRHTTTDKLKQDNLAFRNALRNGEMVVITRLQDEYAYIFPAGAIPQALMEHIKNNPLFGTSNFSAAAQNISPTFQPNDGTMPPPEQARALTGKGLMDLSDHLASMTEKAFTWQATRNAPQKLRASLENGRGYGLIAYNKKPIGIVVCHKFSQGCDISPIPSVSYSTTEFKYDDAHQKLTEGYAVIIKRHTGSHFTIYPISSVPFDIADKIIQDNYRSIKLTAPDLNGTSLNPNESIRTLTAHVFGTRTGVDYSKMMLTVPTIAPTPEGLLQTDGLKGVFIQAAKVARAYKTPVMLLGEEGVGKTAIAQYIHNQSLRHMSEFRLLDLSQSTPSLFEDELFGHEKGAFTGADRVRRSAFEDANHGTVFIDEIGTLLLDLQPRLLRLIDKGIFRRIGGNQDIHTDVRFVVATNANLAEMVKRGQFRKDLFDRLNVFPITVPPLRERRQDILVLAEHFLDCASKMDRIERKTLSNEAKRVLYGHHWPDNSRGLKNAICRATINADGPIIKPNDLEI